MTERPTDDQFAELIDVTEHSYNGGRYPHGMSKWVRAFTDGDGGLLKALSGWRAAEVRIANLEAGRAIEQEMLRNSVPRMSAALALHAGTEVPHEGVSPWCEVCRSPWPCDTWKALTGAPDTETT